ncbi:MAG: FtsW/RodA/SpoVE family cell cycle protein, partial [Croceibacterium sp.]
MTSARPYIPRPGERAPVAPRFKRSRAAQLRVWWREIDHVLLALVLALMAIGAIAVAAASPASARRLSANGGKLDDLYFLWAHLRWQFVGVCVMLGVSMAPRDRARRGGIILGAAMLIFLMLVPVIGSEVNGAKRWISIGMRFQPSEFLKPA